MLLYLDSRFEQHQTHQHPECSARITQLNDLLRESKIVERASCPAWDAAAPAELSKVHDPAYLRQLEIWCSGNAGRIESDTIVSTGSWLAATLGAGAAMDATRRVIAGEDTRAFCAVRPPGHHALAKGPMGFCLLNNVAIAAQTALALGLHRVLIVDWDVHHGNGTQDAFYSEECVSFFSIHRSPFYPGTGHADETGTGPGLGTILNTPVSENIRVSEFFDVFEKGMHELANRCQPELILLSAGFDAHRLDPVGGLCLEEQDFAQLTRLVKQVAESHCDGRLVSLLEGGYHLEHMPASALAHVEELLS